MPTKRVFALTVAAAAGLSLSACADSDDSSTTPVTVTETVDDSSDSSGDNRDDRDDDDADDRDDAAAQPAANGDLPAAVTGYTDEARAEMRDENVSEADVEAVLAAAHDGTASVEWEDDGYFEIENGEVEIDIDPAGLVLDADR